MLRLETLGRCCFAELEDSFDGASRAEQIAPLARARALSKIVRVSTLGAKAFAARAAARRLEVARFALPASAQTSLIGFDRAPRCSLAAYGCGQPIGG